MMIQEIDFSKKYDKIIKVKIRIFRWFNLLFKIFVIKIKYSYINKSLANY